MSELTLLHLRINSGMLFVQSVGGKSHCPEEESRMEDIGKAANVLLHPFWS